MERSELDAAIDKALENAGLRAGGALETSATVLSEHEPTAIEAGDVGDSD